METATGEEDQRAEDVVIENTEPQEEPDPQPQTMEQNEEQEIKHIDDGDITEHPETGEEPPPDSEGQVDLADHQNHDDQCIDMPPESNEEPTVQENQPSPPPKKLTKMQKSKVMQLITNPLSYTGCHNRSICRLTNSTLS